MSDRSKNMYIKDDVIISVIRFRFIISTYFSMVSFWLFELFLMRFPSLWPIFLLNPLSLNAFVINK